MEELTDIDATRDASERIEFMVTWRAVKAKKVAQEVRLEADIDGIETILQHEFQSGFVVIPIGRLLSELANEIWEYLETE